MKRRQFMVLGLLSAAGVGMGTGACRSRSPKPVSQGGKTLIMGTSADYPPYVFIRTVEAGEEIVGFDVDIARSIAAKLGYPLEIITTDFNRLMPLLQAGKFDFAMAGMTPTEDRRQTVDFSEIYYEAKQAIVSRQDRGITTPADLQGKQVGVKIASIEESVARGVANKIGDVQLISLRRIDELVQVVKAGRIDGAILENTVATKVVAANPELQSTVIPDLEATGIAIAFPKDSPLVAQFNGALQEMQQAQAVEKLVLQWFGDGLT